MFRDAVSLAFIKQRRMIGRARSTCGEKRYMQKNVEISNMKYEKTNYIKRIWRKQERKAWTACMWLREDSSGGVMWTPRLSFGFHKRWEISWLAEEQFSLKYNSTPRSSSICKYKGGVLYRISKIASGFLQFKAIDTCRRAALLVDPFNVAGLRTAEVYFQCSTNSV